MVRLFVFAASLLLTVVIANALASGAAQSILQMLWGAFPEVITWILTHEKRPPSDDSSDLFGPE